MSSAAVNYCSIDLGAKIVESSPSSSNPEGVLGEREESIWSAKAEDVAEKPYVVVQLPPHPAIRFVGWHVWQDYSSNPKVVEIAAGMSPNALTDVVHCTALQGPGIQLWELSTPISSSYNFVRFRIVATFGGASAYMNRVFTFSQRPPEPGGGAVAMNSSMAQHATGNSRLGSGPLPSSSMPHVGASMSNPRHGSSMMSSGSGGYYGGGGGGGTMMSHSSAASGGGGAIGGFGAGLTPPRGGGRAGGPGMMSTVPGNRSSQGGTLSNLPGHMADPRASLSAYEAGSPMHMSEMLRELDEDIRLLHPLPVDGLVAKTTAAAARNSSSRQVSPSRAASDPMHHPVPSSSQIATAPAPAPVIAGGSEVSELKREIAELRAQMQSMSRNGGSAPAAASGRTQSPSRRGGASSSSPTSATAHFPHDEMAALVDSIMEPKMMKWARKLEGRILMKVDETLKDLLGQITSAIDARVEQHMKHVIKNHHLEFGQECKICSHHRKCQHSDFDGSSLAPVPAAAQKSSRAAAAAGSSRRG